MITRCTIKDLEYVNYVITHPSIYPFVSDDGSPPVGSFDASNTLKLEGIYFMKPVIDNKEIGLFFLHPWNTICYEVHTCILPEYRGKMAVRACKELKDYMFSNTPCMKIVTHIPVNNKPAQILATQAGMEKEGINSASFLKDGVVIDQLLFGIRKGG